MSFIAGAALVADGESFKSPGTSDFWWPLIGGDSNWAITRPAVVFLVSALLIGWFFVTVTGKKLSVVPSKRQFVAEGVYDFVRNTIGRDIIGSKDFMRFLPLLLTCFTLILFNNVAGIIPFIQYPSTGR
ncbi:MAG: F0F1 ATP synthase subunit A, partial [Dermacoccus nishinomiyaensis]